MRGLRILRRERFFKVFEGFYSFVFRFFLEGWICGDRGMGLSYIILVVMGFWCSGSFVSFRKEWGLIFWIG